ncbi:MAG: stage V sporulation protein S [Caldilineales bacterium]|nr:stage V sporulation protein S [Caldilineales bacterium]MCW5859534.1 stage V sporulation protein S [Caldilineales bacterium]
MEIIRVSARSRSTAVAGAIAGVIRERGLAEVQAIGASAVNQAIKAIAIARGYLQGDGIAIACAPVFTEVDIEGAERTAVRFTVWKLNPGVLPPSLVAGFSDQPQANGAD